MMGVRAIAYIAAIVVVTAEDAAWVHGTRFASSHPVATPDTAEIDHALDGVADLEHERNVTTLVANAMALFHSHPVASVRALKRIVHVHADGSAIGPLSARSLALVQYNLGVQHLSQNQAGPCVVASLNAKSFASYCLLTVSFAGRPGGFGYTALYASGEHADRTSSCAT